ncbi:hypothetical protein SI65_02265 [Aspergillus cristatus]|uniref:Uncharacterized protein n=1 Tax=Aspergillus cristatus TaxID=573508 RepID=A0A1E3BKU1_ASPCR|nr:hypothetical protein SI65_02265 [Aspergillus cristatus]
MFGRGTDGEQQSRTPGCITFPDRQRVGVGVAGISCVSVIWEATLPTPGGDACDIPPPRGLRASMVVYRCQKAPIGRLTREKYVFFLGADFDVPSALRSVSWERVSLRPVTGKDVKIKEISADEYAELPFQEKYWYRGVNLLKDYTSCWEAFRRGEAAVVSPLLGEILGREPEDFETTAVNKPPGRGPKEISLAFACRARTEAITAQKQRWLAKELNKRSQQGKRTYIPQRNWQLDPAVAVAPKHLASQYFQLKSGYAAIGEHLHRIQAQEDATCKGCGLARETIRHLLFGYRKWRHQRNKLYRDLEMDGVMGPTAAEEHPQGRLLGEPRATMALLHFLASTRVALPRAHLQRTAERAQRDDEWGLEALEEAIRTVNNL